MLYGKHIAFCRTCDKDGKVNFRSMENVNSDPPCLSLLQEMMRLKSGYDVHMWYITVVLRLSSVAYIYVHFIYILESISVVMELVFIAGHGGAQLWWYSYCPGAASRGTRQHSPAPCAHTWSSRWQGAPTPALFFWVHYRTFNHLSSPQENEE